MQYYSAAIFEQHIQALKEKGLLSYDFKMIQYYQGRCLGRNSHISVYWDYKGRAFVIHHREPESLLVGVSFDDEGLPQIVNIASMQLQDQLSLYPMVHRSMT